MISKNGTTKYLVRIIPPERKSNAKTFEWHDITEVFSSPAILRLKLMDSFMEKVSSSSDFPVGYITKCGNSECWIEQPADLNSMYGQFESDDTITFFVMENQAKKKEAKAKVCN